MTLLCINENTLVDEQEAEKCALEKGHEIHWAPNKSFFNFLKSRVLITK